MSESLGYGFVDMDDEIEVAAGTAIREIFASQGEEAFRELERQTTRRVAQLDRHVIACGGGVVLDPENLEALRRNSALVLLTASMDEIMARTSGDDGRPLLNVPHRRRQAEALLRARMPKYLEAADLVVDTTGLAPTQVAEEIMAALEATS